MFKVRIARRAPTAAPPHCV